MKLRAFLMACLLALFVLPAVAWGKSEAATPLILISIDGFRADYLDRGVSPNLSALAAGGVRAERMIPSYPSITFPNHYTLVTGLYPDHHGIVNNTFEDPTMANPSGGTAGAATFTMASKEEGWWNEATPIWITAEEHGMHTGVLFWPGAETPHHGVRPSHWWPYSSAIPAAARVDEVLGWLDLPADRRPRFLALYFEPVDGAGHEFGPDSPEVNQAVAQVDGVVGQLVAGLKARGLAANLIVVADHGMAAVGPDHLMLLDNLIDTSTVHVVFEDASLGVNIPDTEAGRHAMAKLLSPHDNLSCWRKGDIPARLHYGTNPRVPDVVCAADTGWLIDTAEGLKRGLALHHSIEKGAHGYDNADPLMGALFIANGPAFRKGLVIKPFPNVDVYPLMTSLLGLPMRPNDGNFADLSPILKQAAP